MPRFARGHFEGDTPLFGERGNIGLGGDAFDAELFAKVFDEGLVGVGFRAANGVVEVRGNDVVPKSMQDVEQRDGVGSAGDANDDARAFGNQAFPLNRRFDFFDQVHNR